MRHSAKITAAACCTLLWVNCCRGADQPNEDWPQFLGPHRDGTSDETGLLDRWPTDGVLSTTIERCPGTGARGSPTSPRQLPAGVADDASRPRAPVETRAAVTATATNTTSTALCRGTRIERKVLGVGDGVGVAGR